MAEKNVNPSLVKSFDDALKAWSVDYDSVPGRKLAQLVSNILRACDDYTDGIAFQAVHIDSDFGAQVDVLLSYRAGNRTGFLTLACSMDIKADVFKIAVKGGKIASCGTAELLDGGSEEGRREMAYRLCAEAAKKEAEKDAAQRLLVLANTVSA